MQTKTGNLHLEIQTSRKNPVGVLRTTAWDKKKKKVSHSQYGRITGCTMEQLKMLQCAFREEVVAHGDPDALKILSSRELGASQMLLKLAKDLGMHKILYSRSEPWVDCVLAMIIGRIVFQGSKLGLCNQSKNTVLWKLCGIEGRPTVEKQCYLPMDRLLERQKAIQKTLAKKHVSDGSMVLYDITSSYFEGEYAESDLVSFGYNRDGKKGHEPVVIGLITNAEGCPVGCEVFKGNTNDATTVMQKVNEVRSSYELKGFIELNVSLLRKRLNLLTNRQREVVELVASGQDNQQIYDTLKISILTVKKHLQMVFKSMGVQHRTQLAARWHQAHSISLY